MSPHLDLRTRLQRRNPLTALPAGFYGDAAQHTYDLELIWYREWLFAGHECEVAKAGEYLTVQVGEYPIIVIRGRDGNLRAYHNTCRHRGSRICSATHGTAQRLTCPYHSWTYRLDGSLLAAPDMGEDFDASKYSLKTVHCASMAGYVFICIAPVAPDFEALRRRAEPYMVPHQLKEAKVAFESTIVEHANWKLVWENNRECYHCGRNHPELLRSFPDQPTMAIGPGGSLADAQIEARWTEWEARGLPSRYSVSANQQTRMLRLPLLEGKESLTISGEAAVNRPLSERANEPGIGTLMFYHYPSTWNHILSDHAVTFRVLPLGPTETQLTTKWLVHRDAVENVDYDVRKLIEVWQATNTEDQRVCQENQIGVSSPAYEPGPYSPIQERGPRQFLDWYCEALQQRLSTPSGKHRRGRAPSAGRKRR
jgi:glycine betaine monooxygenase A